MEKQELTTPVIQPWMRVKDKKWFDGEMFNRQTIGELIRKYRSSSIGTLRLQTSNEAAIAYVLEFVQKYVDKVNEMSLMMAELRANHIAEVKRLEGKIESYKAKIK